MSDQPRPVWLTREQRDDLWHCWMHTPNIGKLVAAWDAAPADATEAVLNVMPGKDWRGVYPDAVTRAVLRALGMPDA